MVRLRNANLLLVVVVLVSAAAEATAQIRLPLDGYYRPGRFMPVLVESDTSTIELKAHGVETTEIKAGRTGIVALLALTATAGPVQAGETNLDLRALQPSERLVGSTPGDTSIAAQLFPGQTIVSVRLDASRPLSGPMMAWETLNAVILDSPPDAKLISELLANGTTLAVRSATIPGTDWPWRRVGDCWVLGHEIAGPVGSIGGEISYLPTQSWQPTHPAGFRRQLILAAILISLLMLSTLLIQTRRASFIAIIVVVMGCCGAIELWRRTRPEIRIAVGQIVVRSPQLIQRDTWQFIAAGPSGAVANLDAGRPVFLDAAHADQLNLKLVFHADGTDQWTGSLPANARLAKLERTVEQPTNLAISTASSVSPLRELARQGYLSVGIQIRGELEANAKTLDEQWPGVLVERR